MGGPCSLRVQIFAVCCVESTIILTSVLLCTPFALAAAIIFPFITGFQQTYYVIWSTFPLFSGS